ncbi:MAG TPA: hypothetical protein VJ836_02075 [Candidatus Saccharimonadales bacterium]|nr:hypothetical protein [Candidatus Saccharimonadales bacterium]
MGGKAEYIKYLDTPGPQPYETVRPLLEGLAGWINDEYSEIPRAECGLTSYKSSDGLLHIEAHPPAECLFKGHNIYRLAEVCRKEMRGRGQGGVSLSLRVGRFLARMHERNGDVYMQAAFTNNQICDNEVHEAGGFTLHSDMKVSWLRYIEDIAHLEAGIADLKAIAAGELSTEAACQKLITAPAVAAGKTGVESFAKWVMGPAFG